MDFNDVMHDTLRQENIKLVEANAELTNRIRLLQEVNSDILEELFKMSRDNKELVQQLNNLCKELDGLKAVKICNDVRHDGSIRVRNLMCCFNRAHKQTETAHS